MQEFYGSWLRDRDYVDARMREIAQSAGIGPRKLERCLKRSKVGCQVMIKNIVLKTGLVRVLVVAGSHKLLVRDFEWRCGE